MIQLEDIKDLVSDYTAQEVNDRINAIKLCMIEIIRKPFCFENNKVAIVVAEKYSINVSVDDVSKARDIYRSIINM